MFVGRVAGAALGEEVDRVEQLEGLDRADDDRDQDDRLHHREDEVAHLVPEAGPRIRAAFI